MASVWKRLQRVNKRAAKFQYTASYHRIDLETSAKWKPTKLSIVWTRRSRRVITEPLPWEPSLKDPLKGSVIYPVPENHTVAVTLFKDSRTNELEDKDWTFVLEDVSLTGKRRRLASCAINMRVYASLSPTQRAISLRLDPTTNKIVSANLQLTLHTVLLREGQATDEDMQSLASLLSVNNNSDIAVLEDLDEDDYTLSDNSTREMSSLREQISSLTQSLTDSSLATPVSLSLDPQTPLTPLQIDENNLSDATPTADAPVLKIPDVTSSRSRPEFLSNLTKLAKTTNHSFATKPDQKFTSSTPTKPFTLERTPSVEAMKPLVFKPKTFSKYNLKPLELKTNLNNIGLDKNENGEDDKTPVNEVNELQTKLDRDKTPVLELLEWCQSSLVEYRMCAVKDLSASWKSGLAFCALIHRYRPDLIDFSGLQPEDFENNLKTALEASSKLGISQVLTAADVHGKAVPDKLAIMTYLFQLRAHFTGSELQVEQLGSEESESSYLVGRHDTDGAMPADLFSREIVTRRSHRISNDRHTLPKQESSESRGSIDKSSSPTAIKDVKDMFIMQSKNILGKVLSPTRDKTSAERISGTKWFTDPLNVAKVNNEPPAPVPARPEKLMTRKELTDPFGSDEEEEPPSNPDHQATEIEDNSPKTPLTPEVDPKPLTPPLSPIELPKPTPQLLSRHDELKERARQLLEATKREAREKMRRKEKEDAKLLEQNGGLTNGDSPSNKPMTEEERQTVLRERARKLIADARAGIVSPTSPLSPNKPRHGTVEIISKQSVMEEIAAAGGVEQLDALLGRESRNSSPASRNSSASPERPDSRSSETRSISSEDGKRSPLKSFSALVSRLTPDKDAADEVTETGSYIRCELEALEFEQKSIDSKAAALELRLRRVMERADDTEEESRLMSQWFNLVNKKNALIRRQMQLNILEQEEDLSRRCELLARELRLSLAVEEWRKTPSQKRRERLLLQELLAAVNERDRLVQEMDEQEKAIANDDEIERNLSQVEIQRKNNCILQ